MLNIYIDGKKCDIEDFLNRIKIVYSEDDNELDESDVLRINLISDIIDMVYDAETEEDLVCELFDYFEDIEFDVE